MIAKMPPAMLQLERELDSSNNNKFPRQLVFSLCGDDCEAFRRPISARLRESLKTTEGTRIGAGNISVRHYGARVDRTFHHWNPTKPCP